MSAHIQNLFPRVSNVGVTSGGGNGDTILSRWAMGPLASRSKRRGCVSSSSARVWSRAAVVDSRTSICPPMPEASVPVRLRFGVFEVDLRAGELRKHGVRLRLQEQPFQ